MFHSSIRFERVRKVGCIKEGHLRGQVLQHSSQVHWSASTDARGILALLQETGDTTNRELEACLRGLAHGLLGRLALTASRHDCKLVC